MPTIVSAAILLAVRHLDIPLPSMPPDCWWELFDVEWEDIWSVAGHIMRLYRPQSVENRHLIMSLVGKKAVRRWLEDHNENGEIKSNRAMT